MIVLGLSGTVIYLLPFMREIYYLPLQRALGLTNTQLGGLMTAFGVTSMLTYIPGGWLADRLSPRVLISAALVLTGLGGFVFAGFPSYPVAMAIHGFWGVTVTGIMWGAMIKATRDWGSAEEQGRAFGLLEAGRGVSEAAAYTGFLALFAWLMQPPAGLSETAALSWIVVCYSAVHVALGAAAWLTLGGERRDDEAPATPAPGLADFVAVLRMPQIWLISIVLLTGYCTYWGAYYFAPYATDAFAMSVVAGAAIGVGKVWLKPVAAAAAGVIADRIGIWRGVALCFVVLIASFLGFAALPGQATLVWLMIANIALASLAVFALRGIYFALLEESGVPLALTGTATGVVSMIGFTPDVFMPLVGGSLLDAYPGETGYRLLFLVIALLSVVGLAATIAIGRRTSRQAPSPSPLPATVLIGPAEA